jgi:hypothetical protein
MGPRWERRGKGRRSPYCQVSEILFLRPGTLAAETLTAPRANRSAALERREAAAQLTYCPLVVT